MTRRCLAALLAVALTAACNIPVASLPPPTPTEPPVIGHWLLEGSSTGEHLWIEPDGTFTEAGGSPFDVGTAGTLSEGETWAGPWAFTAPDELTLDDTRTGARAFRAFLRGAELVLQADQTHNYRFASEPTDAGAD